MSVSEFRFKEVELSGARKCSICRLEFLRSEEFVNVGVQAYGLDKIVLKRLQKEWIAAEQNRILTIQTRSLCGCNLEHKRIIRFLQREFLTIAQRHSRRGIAGFKKILVKVGVKNPDEELEANKAKQELIDALRAAGKL
jgi:hypothetical protein